jgi:hypothetical protein
VAVTGFAVASLPVILPIMVQQFVSIAVRADPSVFYILAPFRNPVHHMFSASGSAAAPPGVGELLPDP